MEEKSKARCGIFYSFVRLSVCRMGVDSSLQENIVATACILLVIAFIVFLLVVARTIIVKWPRLTEEDLTEAEPMHQQMDVWSVQQTESCSGDLGNPEKEQFITQ